MSAGLIASWSFSRYNDYKQCPFKAKCKYVDKLKEPGNKAMDRGNEIHKSAEDYIKSKIAKLPKELANFKDVFGNLRKRFKRKLIAMVVEDTWAFRKDWSKTTYDDWNNCWLRIKVDLGDFSDDSAGMVVTDWKTGKFKEQKNEEYREQLELYALGALMFYPHIEEVYCRLAYTDEGTLWPDNVGLHFTRKDLPKLMKLWEKRVKPMMADKRFPPRPGAYCTYCHFRKANNGPCKY